MSSFFCLWTLNQAKIISSCNQLHMCFKIMSHICQATKYCYCLDKKVNDKVLFSSISASNKHCWSSSLTFGEMHNLGSIKLNQFSMKTYCTFIHTFDARAEYTVTWLCDYVDFCLNCLNLSLCSFQLKIKKLPLKKKKLHIDLINFLHGPHQLAGRKN